jgi:hypothetical protein
VTLREAAQEVIGAFTISPGIATGRQAKAIDRLAAALARSESPSPEGLTTGAHPGEPHEFRTTCLRCGKPGMLHVSLITADETVTIGQQT